MATIANYLALAIANAVNLVRPRQLVLTGEVSRQTGFADEVADRVNDLILSPVRAELAIERWSLAETVEIAEGASWLALAPLYLSNWPLLSFESERSKRGVRPRSHAD